MGSVRAGRSRWVTVEGVRSKICLGLFCKGIPRPVSEYGTRKSKGHIYLRPYCRRCERERARLKDNKSKYAWRKRNPEKVAKQVAKRRVLEVTAGGGGFRTDRADYRERFEAYGWKCAWCNGPFETVDHYRALSRGGTNHPSNIIPSCRSCNSSRKARTPEDWDDRPYLRKKL